VFAQIQLVEDTKAKCSLGSRDRETADFKILWEMSKANSKISVQDARRAHFFWLRNMVCSFLWKIVMDEKMAQGRWSSS